MVLTFENYIDGNYSYLNLMLLMNMLQEKKITLLQTILLEKMSAKDKGKAPMEATNEEQLLKSLKIL